MSHYGTLIAAYVPVWGVGHWRQTGPGRSPHRGHPHKIQVWRNLGPFYRVAACLSVLAVRTGLEGGAPFWSTRSGAGWHSWAGRAHRGRSPPCQEHDGHAPPARNTTSSPRAHHLPGHDELTEGAPPARVAAGSPRAHRLPSHDELTESAPPARSTTGSPRGAPPARSTTGSPRALTTLPGTRRSRSACQEHDELTESAPPARS
jgi:hypothetical protein